MSDDPGGPFLPRLLAPMSAEDFLVRCWPGHPTVAHGPLERLGDLSALPEFSDLELLLDSHRDAVRVALADKRDEHDSVKVDAATALAMHRDGLALILDDVERFFPLVQQWLDGLRQELGLPLRCDPRSLVYVTPRGAGNSPHFDANANFVVQLRGTKRWHVAPNRQVENPTDRWAMNQTELPEELEAYVDAPFPTRMPQDAVTIDLKPGSVLFVPRGHWHATEADEDTLALNFTYGQPTWADVVITGLRTRLLADARWRELAVGLCAPDPQRARASAARLVGMLGELQQQVGKLEPGELIDAVDARPVWLLEPSAFLRIDGGRVMAARGSSAELEVETAQELQPVLAWISVRRSPFSLEELAMHFPKLAPRLSGLLQQLRAIGLLVRHLRRDAT